MTCFARPSARHPDSRSRSSSRTATTTGRTRSTTRAANDSRSSSATRRSRTCSRASSLPWLRPRPLRRRSDARVKKLGVALAVVAALLLLAAGFVVLSSLPGRSGRRAVAGLRAPVRIDTDVHGVPSIHAASVDDAFFGLGWAHARDRLWQMELQRRIGSGRLAEVLGGKLVTSDRFLR